MPNNMKRMANNELQDMYLKEGLELAKRVAGSMKKRLPACAHEDLLGEAHFGLVKALKTFDGSKGIPFQAYAQKCMKNAIFDELRKNDDLSKYMRLLFNILKEHEKKFESQHHRKPTREELARMANTTPEKVAEVTTLGLLPDEENKLFLSSQTPFRLAREMELRAEINNLLKNLSKDEATIIRGVFSVGKSYAELAEDLNTSEMKVIKVYNETLKKLREIA